MKFKLASFILILSLIAIVVFNSCGDETIRAKENFVIVEEGNTAVLEKFPIAIDSESEDYGASYDHYFICLYQNGFQAESDEKSKSLIAKTIGAPRIEQCLVNGFNVPKLENQYFNYLFSSGANQVYLEDGIAASLEIEDIDDIPLEVSTKDNTYTGSFPAINHNMIPKLNTWTPERLRRDEQATLEWVPDENYDGKVIIQLFGTSRVPDELHTKNIIVDDSGSYTFTPDDFSGFPVNARIKVSIKKGNYQITSERIFLGSAVIMYDATLYILMN